MGLVAFFPADFLVLIQWLRTCAARMRPQRRQQNLEQMRDALAAWLAGADDADILEDMGAFAPVRDIKNRHKCVTLAFEASAKALSGKA